MRLHVMAHLKGDQRYLFLWRTPDDAARVMQQMGRFASDPELSFTWDDAALCSQKVRQQSSPLPTNH